MEIIIRFVEGAHTDKGVNFWRIEDVDEKRYSCWDKKIAEELEKSIGEKINVEVKTSPDGKFKNIRGIGGKTAQPTPSPALVETQQGVRSLNGQEQLSVPSEKIRDECRRVDKDKSIIAQCLVKAVLGQTTNTVVFNIKDAVEMYHEALRLLNGT